MKDEVLNASDLLNERDEKTKNVNDKAENLAESSYKYKKTATKVKKDTKKRKIYITFGTTVAILIILYALVSIACGSWTFQCGS